MADLEWTSVLRKTESGIDAIKVRDHALTPKQRMLLIMVDGVKTVAQLLKGAPKPDEDHAVYAELLTNGYVSELDIPKPVELPEPAAAPQPVVARPVSNASDASLTAGVRRATHALEDLLGPDCTHFCLQLEKCRSLEEFTAKVNELRDVVASVRSAKKADEFAAKALNP